MCGITGIYALDDSPIQAQELSAQIDTIVHRGPNQGATFLSPQQDCGLGIRRLSIIDVAQGHQPLSNEDGSIHLVYNGETYNYRQLRRELEQLGHYPRTQSDGEVILHGYEAWGPAQTMQRIGGMAAFALWDERQKQLFLGRDRFGIKPLYYAIHAKRLYFASEIKAILAAPTFPRRVNLAALEAMLTVGFVPGPETMFSGIYKLPAAHYLLAKAGTFQIKPYWNLTYRENDAPLSEWETAEQFRALLTEAVQDRLMSEVPLGALLSGGLDSGTIVALVQAALSRKLKTISIGFEQAPYDEASLAADMARFIGTEHYTTAFQASSFDDYPVVMTHLEEPQCSATAIPVYRLYQACREQGLTVVLTGEGADELLGGYHWHKGDALMRPLLFLPPLLRQTMAKSPLPMSNPARRVLVRGNRDLSTRYQDWLAVESNGYQAHLLAAEPQGALAQNGPNPLLSNWAAKLTNLETDVPLHQRLWLETQTRLVDFINMEVDKMSMAHSIEARVPFLDHRLWEFCAQQPARYKLKGRTEKALLRRAVRDILPQATQSRRKKGLAAPYAHWLQQAQLPDWAETVLSEHSLNDSGLFDPQTVPSLRGAVQAGATNLGPLLMGVLSTQVWFDQFNLER